MSIFDKMRFTTSEDASDQGKHITQTKNFNIAISCAIILNGAVIGLEVDAAAAAQPGETLIGIDNVGRVRLLCSTIEFRFRTLILFNLKFTQNIT